MSDDTNDEAAPGGPGEAPSPVSADRWAVVAGIGVLAIGFGLVTQNRAVLAAAVVPLAFVAYARLSTAADPDLTARRSLDPVAPAVGDRVEVTVTVRNRGRALRDCRLADAVPPELPVVDGAPAMATTLRPGEEVSFSYVVRARRGVHELGPLRAAAVAGAGADAATADLAAESRLRCRATGAADAAGAPSANAGDAATDSRGGGVEFHAVREYRRSDPLSRVDWRRFARTGELATVEFREDRAATVAIVVDASAPTYRRATADAPAAVEYALFAAEGAFEALLERDARVALAFHPDAPGALGPGTGVDHRTLGRRAFDAYGPGATRDPAEVPVALGPAGDPASREEPAAAAGGATDTTGDRAAVDETGTDPSAVRSDGGDPFGSAFEPADDEGGTDSEETTDSDGADDEAADETAAYDPGTAFEDAGGAAPEADATTALRAALPSGARVLFCSPLLADDTTSLIRTLRADDHDVRVLSPAPEPGGPATRLATLERADRVTELRAGGVGVVDWTDEPLREALARTLRGW
jgi:uncharacterized protein (DUF58 family)